VTANIPMWNGCVQAVLWHQRIGQVIGCVGWWRGRSILGVPGSTHTGTLHLPGGSNFDPPGSTHHWYSLSLPKWSAGEMRQHGLLMRRAKWSSNESRGACARSEMMGQWWSCTTWELGAAQDVSVRDAGGGSSGLSIQGAAIGGTW
jgi:hypothetical protein